MRRGTGRRVRGGTERKCARHPHPTPAPQARYQTFSPDVARPAHRLYVGGLPAGAAEAALAASLNSLLALAGAAIAPGPPITACEVRVCV